MSTISLDPNPLSASSVWKKTLKALITQPVVASPRGMPIMEIVGHRTRINMSQPVVNNPARNLGFKFMAAEAHWILTGDNRVSTIEPYSKAIKNFSDNGKTFFGSYGPKILDQMTYVIEKLLKDPHSRQAVINIWRENPPETKDVPCTLSLQFLYRDHELHCIANMRSSDIWLGWPYDVFNFSMISAGVLTVLKDASDNFLCGNLGYLTLNAGSQHLYVSNEAAAQDCINTPDGVCEEFDHYFFDDASELVDYLGAAKDKKHREWMDNKGKVTDFLTHVL
jgi:thymidylate synthase